MDRKTKYFALSKNVKSKYRQENTKQGESLKFELVIIEKQNFIKVIFHSELFSKIIHSI